MTVSAARRRLARAGLAWLPAPPRRSPFGPHAPAFTLLETLIAAVLLVIALLGVAASISCAARNDMNARESGAALNAALAQMEILRGLPYSTLPGLDRSTFSVAGLGGAGAVGTLAVTVTRPDLCEVSVTVSWRGVAGVRSFSLTSQFSRQ